MSEGQRGAQSEYKAAAIIQGKNICGSLESKRFGQTHPAAKLIKKSREDNTREVTRGQYQHPGGGGGGEGHYDPQ